MRHTSGLDNTHKWCCESDMSSGVAVEARFSGRQYRLVGTMARPCDIETLGEYSFIIAARNSTSAQELTIMRSGLLCASGEAHSKSTAYFFIFTKGDAPTLTILELIDMEGADGKNLRIIPRIAAGDYMTFGMRLLQDKNGDHVELIKRDHRQDGTESVVQAIIRKWLANGAAPTQHLIECLRKSGLGALAEDIDSAIACEGICDNTIIIITLTLTIQICTIVACRM